MSLTQTGMHDPLDGKSVELCATPQHWTFLRIRFLCRAKADSLRATPATPVQINCECERLNEREQKSGQVVAVSRAETAAKSAQTCSTDRNHTEMDVVQSTTDSAAKIRASDRRRTHGQNPNWHNMDRNGKIKDFTRTCICHGKCKNASARSGKRSGKRSCVYR